MVRASTPRSHVVRAFMVRFMPSSGQIGRPSMVRPSRFGHIPIYDSSLLLLSKGRYTRFGKAPVIIVLYISVVSLVRYIGVGIYWFDISTSVVRHVVRYTCIGFSTSVKHGSLSMVRYIWISIYEFGT